MKNTVSSNWFLDQSPNELLLVNLFGFDGYNRIGVVDRRDTKEQFIYDCVLDYAVPFQKKHFNAVWMMMWKYIKS